MSETAEAIVLALFIVATSIWVGGYVAIAVVARTASATLDGAGRVAFFRSLGRSYLLVGFPALVLALALGALLARNLDWDALLITTVVVATVLLASFGVAVAQARRMTRLRRSLLARPNDEELSVQVRRGARAAASLRDVLGLLISPSSSFAPSSPRERRLEHRDIDSDIGDALLSSCRELLARLDEHNSEEPIIYPHADTDLTETATTELAEFLRPAASLPAGSAKPPNRRGRFQECHGARGLCRLGC